MERKCRVGYGEQGKEKQKRGNVKNEVKEKALGKPKA